MKTLKITDQNHLFQPMGLRDLGIDVRGIDLRDITQLWIWLPIPEAIVEPNFYKYSLTPTSPRGGECTKENSVHISSRGKWYQSQTELDGQQDSDKVWVCIDIPDNLPYADFLLINTIEINVPGYGR